MSGINKLTADRNQRILLDLVAKPGNGAFVLSDYDLGQV